MSATRSVRLLALVATFVTPAVFAAGNAENGKELFVSKACSACHAVTKDAPATAGPNLAGVVGRKAGEVAGLIPTTEALKNYGVKWNAKTLDEFLADPMGKVPGTAMGGSLPDTAERADIIAYLATLK